jgi:membrane fusion protein, copper/silver efflux system
MKKIAYTILLFLLIAGVFLAGSWYNQHTLAKQSQVGERKVLYYMDPMHPSYKSNKPGIAPDCGMNLVAVYADGGPAEPEGSSASLPSGSVKVSYERQQLIGVRVASVKKASGTYSLRLFGRVAADETRVYKLVAGVDGFIRQVSMVTTGSQVGKDHWLATFSAPEARSPLQAYLITLDVADRQRRGGADAPAQFDAANASSQLAIDRLLNLGMSHRQIEEIKRTRQLPTNIKILAPAGGFVLARNVSLGQKFEKGMEWYRIADLRRVWIVADVSENEAQYLHPGVRAKISLPNQSKTLSAKVSDVLPQFDGATRTLKVRLEADNPGYVLRPDMFVDVELPVKFPSTIAVPADAVLDSGRRKTVFVERGEGFFEPRQVETGRRFDDQVEILDGLLPGEQVVVSSNFLIDSESRLKAAVASMSAPVKDLVCGMAMDQSKAKAAARKTEHGNNTYYFCSEQCKQKFDKEPGRYLEPEEHKHAPNRLARAQYP